eukprot:COSAG01_NODE_21675_length_890_cov_1735.596713_2_plen_154_part_01
MHLPRHGDSIIVCGSPRRLQVRAATARQPAVGVNARRVTVLRVGQDASLVRRRLSDRRHAHAHRRMRDLLVAVVLLQKLTCAHLFVYTQPERCIHASTQIQQRHESAGTPACRQAGGAMRCTDLPCTVPSHRRRVSAAVAALRLDVTSNPVVVV